MNIEKRPNVSGQRKTWQVQIGKVCIGNASPVVVQSMTNTDTANVAATVHQIKQLVDAGSEMVRITVNTPAAAAAVASIREQLDAQGYDVPLIGDFHFNGDRLLKEFPRAGRALSKYRINPGNVGHGVKRDDKFAFMIQQAIKNNKPIRIGVNWGSLDQELAKRLIEANNCLVNPLPTSSVMREALIVSALESAEKAVELGLPENKVILSCKVSHVQDLIAVYTDLAQRCAYPLHLGLTEAGMGSKGIVASTAALAILLQQGIGDTIRVSLTPAPGESRTKEVTVAQEILQTLGLRSFMPQVTACPGCGRTTSEFFQELAKKVQIHLQTQMSHWRERYPGVDQLNVAVMGCVVNGPGESKLADIGISLPGTGEVPVAPVYIDGVKTITLKGANIADEFITIINEYVDRRYSKV